MGRAAQERKRQVVERDARIVEMHGLGMTFGQIAGELGLHSDNAAYKSWLRSMRRAPAAVVDLERKRHLDELDGQLRRLHLMLRAPHYLVQGGQVVRGLDGEPMLDDGFRLQVEDRISRNILHRSRIIGTEAPQRARVEYVDVDQLAEAVAEMERRAAEMAARRQASLPPGQPVIDVEAVDDEETPAGRPGAVAMGAAT